MRRISLLKGKKQFSIAMAAIMAVTGFQVVPPQQAKADTAKGTVVASFDFEGEDTQGWGPRGDESAAITADVSHTGKQAVKITDRTESWNGITCNCTDLLEDGESYTIEAYVMYDDNKVGYQQSMMLSVQTTIDGKDSYNNLTTANVYCGSWVKVEGNFTYVAGTDLVNFYIEGGTHDFYIDDVTITRNPAAEIEENIPSLKDVFAPYNCKVGTAVVMNEFNSSEKKIIKKHFNSLTIGNEMKPDSVLDYDATVAYMEETGDQTTPQITLSKAAPILKYCEANGIEIRGHVLAWHSQTPKWFFTENYSQDSNAKFVSKEVMLERLENYIKAVFATVKKQFPDLKIYTWDVVNEACSDNGGYRAAGTEANKEGSLWMQVIGEDFIEAAFTYARKYAPEGTNLAYNDYNEYMGSKTNMIYKVASNLADKGLIDVIGMQMHLDMDFPSVDMFESAARKFASVPGVKLEITEFDITTWDSTKSGFEKQGQKVKAFFDCAKSLMAEGIEFNSITFWGVRDCDSWRAQRCPLLFDDNYLAKPAFYGVVGDTVITSKEPVVPSKTPAVSKEPVVPSKTPAVSKEPVVPSKTPAVSKEPVVPSKAPVVSKEPVQGAPSVTVNTTAGSTINQTYKIVPNGGAVDTSKLVIRFYYTKDDSKAQAFWCDNAGIQTPSAPYYVPFTTNVKGTFGDGYVDISFDKAATFTNGDLTLQVRITQQDWSNFTNLECGDVEVYYDGVRVQ
ncbi:endo-1,4-beta-xylanase [[Clostridium] polysaccharolyticum]|uniref:Beta-xylanase n=1 Tax=[Clostridium] polysaccharolyticum TaxID=29364 RepID=A0A1I0BEU3_9FIRM|nr:endo-1,4-beta-xylanase [[Clostridium] polysaccharolyticum]SET05389.1 endo-1,4-beta-xylanase [[Clostridium] polysaccharolyticum]